MTKLDWYEDTDMGMSDEGVEEAPVYRTHYKGYDLEVYPVSLIDKEADGWEYKIINEEKDVDFDSFSETSNGYDHADTPEEAMEWAESTLEDYAGKIRKSKKVRA